MRNNFRWAENLRAFATVSVILVHVSSNVLTNHKVDATNSWWIANIYDSIFRVCVPFFLMLTGALLLPKSYTIGDFIKRRISKVLWPFLFWSLIYIGILIKQDCSSDSFLD